MPSSSSSVVILGSRRVAVPLEINRPCPSTQFQRSLESVPFDPFDTSRVTTWLGSLTRPAQWRGRTDAGNDGSGDYVVVLGQRFVAKEVNSYSYGNQQPHHTQPNINTQFTVPPHRESSLSSPSTFSNINGLIGPGWTWQSTGFYPQSPIHSSQPGALSNRCNASPPVQPQLIATNSSEGASFTGQDWINGRYCDSDLESAELDEGEDDVIGQYYRTPRHRNRANLLGGFDYNHSSRHYYHISPVGDGDGGGLDEKEDWNENWLDSTLHDPHISGVDGHLNGSSGYSTGGPLAPTGANSMLPTFGAGRQDIQNAPVGRTSRPAGIQGEAERPSSVQRLSDRSHSSPSTLRNTETPRADSRLAVVITSPPARRQSQTLSSSAGGGSQFGGLHAREDTQNHRLSTSRIVPPSRDNRPSRMTVPSKQSNTNRPEILRPPPGDTPNKSSSATKIGPTSKRPNPFEIEPRHPTKKPFTLQNKGGRPITTPLTTTKPASNANSSSTVPKKRGRPFSTPEAAAKAATKAAARALNAGSTSTTQIKKRQRQVGTSEFGSSNGEPKKRLQRIEEYPSAPVEPRYLTFMCQWKGCTTELHNLPTLRAHVYTVHCSGQKAGMLCQWGKCGVSKMPHIFTSKGNLKRHIEEAHLVPFGWHMGDGPKTPFLATTVTSELAIFEPWLYDDYGRQVTPSVARQRVEGGDARFNNLRRFQKQLRGDKYTASKASSPSRNETDAKSSNDTKAQASRGMNVVNGKPKSGGIMVVLPPVKSPGDYRKVPVVMSDDEDPLALSNRFEEVADSDEEM